LIALREAASTKIVPAAWAGKDAALMAAINALLASAERAPTTMLARAMHEKRSIVANDSRTDPAVLISTQYAASGIRSIAVLPLLVADEAVGALALYATEPQFFQEDELQLLHELASDIAFAIDHIGKQDRLNYLAYYDVLTGLANQSLFLERLAQSVRGATLSGHKLAVFLIDLDRFKNINDSVGQAAGDELLRQVAGWFTRRVGDAALLARLGADHFAALLPVIQHDGEVDRLIDDTMAAFLAHPFSLNDAVFRISAKTGVAVFPEDGRDADSLFRNAEAALKKAKASGERCLFYTPTMNDSVVHQITLENLLRQALDKHEFELYYQPKVNLVSGKMTSAEALIRWNDPRTGLVPPGQFIPVLEQTGLIHEVGRWALQQALADYRHWRGAGLPAVRIAVNVSARQLRHRGFIAEVKLALGVDALAAPGLELEITESLLMEDVMHSIASLRAIRDMGVSIAIDDFGTGFSSLSYLAKFPVDTLKIDRSFVTEMVLMPENLALVSTIINLAHALKLRVVAEGVETDEQARLLRLLNCDEMQGYLFSEPVPRAVFEARFLAALQVG
jgi:diguanylate cyclase (GGDEF)-like protein